MRSGDPFGVLVALGLFLAVALVGAGLLWIWDQLTGTILRRSQLDRCLTCHKLLRYRPETHDYERHRCRPL